MKKKIFGGIAVLAVAVVVAWNVNVKSRTDVISDVKLANVEALADELQEVVISCSASAPDCPFSPFADSNRGQCWRAESCGGPICIFCTFSGKMSDSCCWNYY